MPVPTGFLGAITDKDGLRWTPEVGLANKMMRLDPKTGEIRSYRCPEHGPGDDPLGGAGAGRLGVDHRGRLQEARAVGPRHQEDHRVPGRLAQDTIRMHPDGRSGRAVASPVFDPKTETYTHIPEVPKLHGIALDQKGNVWFTEMTKTGAIGRSIRSP